jgi:hypothetical protein
MPGRTYAMGFLRSYADHLGYDGTEVVRRLKLTGPEEGGESLQVRQPVAENRLPSLGVLLLALLLAGFAYGGWYAAQSGGDLVTRITSLPGGIGQFAATYFDEDQAEAASIETPETGAIDLLQASGSTSATAPTSARVPSTTAQGPASRAPASQTSASQTGPVPSPACKPARCRRPPRSRAGRGGRGADRPYRGAGRAHDHRPAGRSRRAEDRRGAGAPRPRRRGRACRGPAPAQQRAARWRHGG